MHVACCTFSLVFLDKSINVRDFCACTNTACFLQKPNRATSAQLMEFHTKEYIEFLERAKPETVSEQEVEHFNVIEDSPIFDGVFQFCQIYAGASLHGAQKLIQDDYDIAINWAGGLHHAKKGQAEGAVTFVSQEHCTGQQHSSPLTLIAKACH